MVALSDGAWPSRMVLLAARLCVAGPLALIAGCASEKAPNYVQGSMAQHVASAQPRKVEMEDDGEPVQPPPARATRPDEDDPNQPWSPNYGRGGAAPAQQSQPNGRLPKQVDASAADSAEPASWQRAATDGRMTGSTGTLTHLSNREADDVVAQAISAQEMRRQ
jgi:hypothetical protein